MDLFRNPGLEINQKQLAAPQATEVYTIQYQTLNLANTKLIVYVQPTGNLDFVFAKIDETAFF